MVSASVSISLASFTVALLGALVYAFSKNTKAAELGRLAFAVALLAFLLHLQAVGTLKLP